MRPRATVEVRNDSGQSLLSIAAQNDDLELAQVDMMMECECFTTMFIHYRYNTSLASSYSRIGRLCWMTTSPTAATS